MKRWSGFRRLWIIRLVSRRGAVGKGRGTTPQKGCTTPREGCLESRLPHGSWGQVGLIFWDVRATSDAGVVSSLGRGENEEGVGRERREEEGRGENEEGVGRGENEEGRE